MRRAVSACSVWKVEIDAQGLCEIPLRPQMICAFLRDHPSVIRYPGVTRAEHKGSLDRLLLVAETAP